MDLKLESNKDNRIPTVKPSSNNLMETLIYTFLPHFYKLPPKERTPNVVQIIKAVLKSRTVMVTQPCVQQKLFAYVSRRIWAELHVSFQNPIIHPIH